uniref:NADP-dependent oxidoreductase domain-containing protein n=1 Tax=Thermosporothrix sp. COM3 TaxID=2490863 RepID=A0A455SJM6_9CHLR|nr:hypothetical protein KTC_22620 [Thermosporothrix sp. COM3]
MRYKVLGKSGLRVSELALGTMTFGEGMAWGASREESRKIFEAYAEAGGNFIDAADVYMGGESEKLVGDFIAADRDRFVLSTKYAITKKRQKAAGFSQGDGWRRKPAAAGRSPSLDRRQSLCENTRR